MQVRTETTQRFTFGQDDLKELIIEHLKTKGVVAAKSDIRFQVSGGDPGGYGSMGDPMHVYNAPTDPSFGGAEVTIRKWD